MLSGCTSAGRVALAPTINHDERVARVLYPKGAGKVVESVDSGYLPPHQARVASMSADVRHAANVDWGMPLMQG